ncbi:MAG: primosomal protein N' [Chloroflexi bacterium]|nr:primosomal protein N' [Chloroflexota bacterium]MBL7061735.1 primosomal protein N' [Dehalococcoidia bacterium]
MKYAEVAVNSPIAQRRSFCYSIPPELEIDIGQAIRVPFGSKILQGIVVKVSDYPSFEVTKEISGLITSFPLLSSAHIEVVFWLSKYYLSPLFDAVALMLPPGFERRLATFLQLLSDHVDLSQLSPEQVEVISLLENRDRVDIRELKRKFGKKKTELVTQQLLRRHLVVQSQQLEETKVKPKLVTQLELKIGPGEAEAEVIRLRKAKADKQAAVLEFLIKRPQPIPLTELRKSIPCQKVVIESLKNRGLISVVEVEVRRDPLAHLRIVPTLPPKLTPSQEAAWQKVRSFIIQRNLHRSPSVFLLHGVTGSGKTEIYLRALADFVAQGKRGICLVPEIALTPQTIERFASRFPGRVAVIHSGLSLGEQFDEWYRIKEGGCDVVIGPRSALFAPQPDLGLIVIDEEHEWTYKQSDKSPRYHARDAAIKLAELTGAVVILGSATPDVETFYRAQQGEYQLIELKERITPYGPSPLPEVEVVDLKEELKAGNRSLFSRSLVGAMTEALARNEQAILFLNRRGTATFVQCRDCGFVFRCSHCTASLTYHSATKKLVCHHCRYSIAPPAECPQCLSHRLRFLGIGTQRVEEEVRHFFPQARVLRWDRDVTSGRRAHEELLAKFRAHEADVLIGTQMIAKGLDLPQITLTGVISADTGLNLPDFRAGERTFQLLCQVAGRAGRGFMPGRAIIQTYSPEHYAIRAASKHDYLTFYAQEIDYRRKFVYPPFSQLASLAFSHTNESTCLREAERMSRLLAAEKDRRGMPGLRLIGPVPAFVPRVRGRYRWQLVLCGTGLNDFLTDIAFPRGWIVDMDPVGVV